MRTITVYIERGKDGTYGAYVPEDMPYGIIGEGNSVLESIEDFKGGYEDMKEHYHLTNKEFEEFDFVFKYDIPSFIAYYCDRLSLAGISRITGVNQGQLSHYLTGRRRPSEKTAKKIQDALHAFGKEISEVNFV